LSDIFQLFAIFALIQKFCPLLTLLKKDLEHLHLEFHLKVTVLGLLSNF